MRNDKIYKNSSLPRGVKLLANMLSHDTYGDFVTPFIKAQMSFVKRDVFKHKAKKAEALDLPRSKYYEEMAKLKNRQGIRRLETTRATLKKAIKVFPKLEKSCGELPKDRREEILGDCDLLIKNALFEISFSPELTKEVWREYNEMKSLIIKKGRSGLLEYGDKKLEELHKIRKGSEREQSRGNYVPVLEIIAAAVVIGIILGAVIQCYQKHGCVRIEEIFAGVECITLYSNFIPQELWPAHCLLQYGEYYGEEH